MSPLEWGGPVGSQPLPEGAVVVCYPVTPDGIDPSTGRPYLGTAGSAVIPATCGHQVLAALSTQVALHTGALRFTTCVDCAQLDPDDQLAAFGSDGRAVLAATAADLGITPQQMLEQLAEHVRARQAAKAQQRSAWLS